MLRVISLFDRFVKIKERENIYQFVDFTNLENEKELVRLTKGLRIIGNLRENQLHPYYSIAKMGAKHLEESYCPVEFWFHSDSSESTPAIWAGKKSSLGTTMVWTQLQLILTDGWVDISQVVKKNTK